MKKINVLLVLLSIIGLFTTSCVKDNNENVNVTTTQQVKHSATGQRIINDKTANSSDVFVAAYVISSSVGHTATECGNACTTGGGVSFHVNCQGWGTTCASTATVDVRRTGGKSHTYIASTMDDYGPTDELTYNMPARSFYVADAAFENGFIWLNVPEQQLTRTSSDQPFHYTGITFTTTALFLNL